MKKGTSVIRMMIDCVATFSSLVALALLFSDFQMILVKFLVFFQFFFENSVGVIRELYCFELV